MEATKTSCKGCEEAFPSQVTSAQQQEIPSNVDEVQQLDTSHVEEMPSSPLAEPFSEDDPSKKEDSESTDLEFSEGDAETEALEQPEGSELPQPDYDQSDEENVAEEDNHSSNEPSEKLREAQEELQKHFQSNILPLLMHFENLAKERDEVFHLNSNMLSDLLPYVHGYISMRYNDFSGQCLVAKMMFERVFTSQQTLYKHIIKEQLREVASWDDFDRQCFQ